MDSYESARAVFSRIQCVDPDNASKIIAYILLQDQPEKEMMRLAFGPDNLIRSFIKTAKSELGISSNSSSAPNCSPSPPLSNPISISRPNPRSLFLPSPGLVHTGFNPTSPSSPSIWSISGSSNHLSVSPDSNYSPSYAAVVNGTGSFNGSLPSLLTSSSPKPENEAQFHDGFFGTDSSSSSGLRHNSSEAVGSCRFDALEEYQQELMRLKLAQHQKLAAAHYMASVNLPYNKMNLLQSEVQRSAAAALMMEEDYQKLNSCRLGRNYFSGLGSGDSNPVSTQIYLTFPADSTFMEEDVSSYFSIYGPVQDVRIPYQQKRMFGFVTFMYPETVKLILAKGNPHFVCDSRVLVKPYKEKGKLCDKKQQQQFDRSELSSFGSPYGLDCREPFEMPVGPRMFKRNQEMMLRKKLEQEADWQHALELQSRRLMNLQFPDLKNRIGYQQNLPAGSPPHSLNQNIPLGGMYNVELEDNNGIKEDNPKLEQGSVFASPERSSYASKPAANTNDNLLTPPTSALNMPSYKSCFLEIPRISSSHEAIGMQ